MCLFGCVYITKGDILFIYRLRTSRATMAPPPARRYHDMPLSRNEPMPCEALPRLSSICTPSVLAFLATAAMACCVPTTVSMLASAKSSAFFSYFAALLPMPTAAGLIALLYTGLRPLSYTGLRTPS